jgi:periplasmic protein TonB
MKLIHMKSSEILQADLLDILFEDRNKEYGAYELRRAYGGRLRKALGVVGIIVIALFAVGFVAGRGAKRVAAPMIVRDDTLTNVTPPVEQPVPPKPLPVPAPKVEMIRFVTPKVTPDQEVKKQEMPDNDRLDSVKIGTVNTPGAKDGDFVAPPVSDEGKGVVDAPKKNDDDEIFRKVEIQSDFPGGLAAWKRYLERTMHYPDEAINKEIQGSIMVRFIVDKDGNVSDVEAISGPEEGGLREEAVRVIKKSGRWTPAVQNGRYVKSYKQQPVTFRLGD